MQPGPSARSTFSPSWRGRGRGRGGGRRRGKGLARRGGGNSSSGDIPSKMPASETVAQEASFTKAESVRDGLENKGAEPPSRDTPTKDIIYIDTSPSAASLPSSQGKKRWLQLPVCLVKRRQS